VVYGVSRHLQPIVSLAALVAGTALVLAGAVADPSPRLDHPAVRHSALLAVLGWGLAVGLMLSGRSARWAWPSAWLMFVVHVAAAFQLAHGWSHEAAYRHTEATAGVGAGIYVNYVFALVWAADAAWHAGCPRSHAARPRWMAWAIHGFLAFVVFNATVVFGSMASRLLGTIVFVGLGIAAVRRRAELRR
jgi:hypothetical protein